MIRVRREEMVTVVISLTSGGCLSGFDSQNTLFQAHYWSESSHTCRKKERNKEREIGMFERHRESEHRTSYRLRWVRASCESSVKAEK